MIDVIFDTNTGQLSVEYGDLLPGGAILRARLNRHGRVTDLRGVEMRVELIAGDEFIYAMALPPPGVRYSKTSQDTLASDTVRWEPEQVITLNAWCRSSEGFTAETQATFTTPPLEIDDTINEEI